MKKRVLFSIFFIFLFSIFIVSAQNETINQTAMNTEAEKVNEA